MRAVPGSRSGVRESTRAVDLKHHTGSFEAKEHLVERLCSDR
jgi:hypothetical protein